MARHTITGGLYLDLYAQKYGWKNQIRFITGKPSTFSDNVLIIPYTLEVEIPDSFDPRVAEANALREQEKELDAKYAATKADIQARINNLLAITNEVKEPIK